MLHLVSLLGVFALLGLCVALSRDRRAISWRLVAVGMLSQGFLAGVFLYWEKGNEQLQSFGVAVKDFLGLAQRGTVFVFGNLGSAEFAREGPIGFVLATQVLPTLIFFASLMAVLYHVGIMQLVVRALARVTAWLMRTSGAESLSACGNIFVGQTEAPLLVRPFLARMTMSELHAVMTGGFATIAGGVFAVYVGFGIDPGHLIVASVLGAPAGLVCSKILWPETERSETMGRVVMPDVRTASNVVEAAANGALDGLRLALNVGAMLIAFLGLVAVLDWLLGHAGTAVGVEELSVGRILGWLFSPVAAVMGVSSEEIGPLAQLLGTKIVLTELIAYKELAEMDAAGRLSDRAVMIASFALCGFANVGSVAIQIGGLGAIAPERKSDLARIAFRAMFAGAIATCITACIAGAIAAPGDSG